MPPARSKQTRLAWDDPEADAFERFANYRILRKPYLSATALASFSYCNVKPFLERILDRLNLRTQTVAMRAGWAAHEEVQGALLQAAEEIPLTLSQALEKKRFQFACERSLKDARRKLRGIADIAFAQGGKLYLVELKNTFPPTNVDSTWAARVRYEHGLQLQFYAQLARHEFHQRPRLGLVHLKEAPKEDLLAELSEDRNVESTLSKIYASSETLEATPEAKRIVDETVQAFRRTERTPKLPLPTHQDPSRCKRCPVQSWCPRRMDKPGHFEALSASRLEEIAPSRSFSISKNIRKS